VEWGKKIGERGFGGTEEEEGKIVELTSRKIFLNMTGGRK